MTEPTAKKPRSKRVPLSAERIAAEAMQLVDEAGLNGFSFRNLAARLGCQAMSLYHYYPSKAHLFEALIDICIAETPLPPEDLHWRERIFRFCLNYRDTALRHPGFFLYFATFRLNNASGLAFLDAIVKMMAGSGLEPKRLALHFRAISYYVTGAGVDESLGYAKGSSAVEPVPGDVAARDYPSIIGIGQYFGKAHHGEMFEHGLNELLDRMEVEAKAL
ncbi:TetR/AcrR family transcriptional regulator [Defluviimonas sp. WL0050]|uniref:TetR/AcrR family transcriptional regulator n=1 Tax=Albidovulum litorale TaxID=2984134 RepID=A0ABT2ZKS1_9RHOB|nr:TetR/AcrR family transcriptional regulator [Defluviimonas sp. WL0050]MCV2871734.1 TetR/AcrR family transcriptional regulator [Defluviimonas sp. WL0050]